MPNGDQNIQRLYRLYENEYFSILGNDLTQRLLRTKIVRYYNKGEIITLGDEVSSQILFIHEGMVKVLAYLMDGREFVIDTSAPGGVLGEIDVLRRTKPAFEVQALAACEIWSLDGKLVRDAIETDPDLSRNLLYYAVRRIEVLEERIICLTTVSISSRLANTLLRLSETGDRCGTVAATINISQHELASMLPASREKVNRCLREWARSRIVDLAPGIITITNPRALHDYAVC